MLHVCLAGPMITGNQALVAALRMQHEVSLVSRCTRLGDSHAVHNSDVLVLDATGIRATLRDGSSPAHLPAGTIWQRVEGREWTVTVGEFTPEKARQLREQNSVDHVEVIDVGLEDLFKDLVKGQRAVP